MEGIVSQIVSRNPMTRHCESTFKCTRLGCDKEITHKQEIVGDLDAIQIADACVAGGQDYIESCGWVLHESGYWCDDCAKSLCRADNILPSRFVKLEEVGSK